MRFLASLSTALLVLVLIPTAASAQTGDKDCSDFANQAQAQAYLLPGDPHRLDADDDGKACDSLPCPCATSGSPAPAPTPAPVEGAEPEPQKSAVKRRARIVRVIDGDTVKVRYATGRRANVRLLGLEAPERRPRGRRAECGALQATQQMRKLALRKGNGRPVMVIADPTQETRDRYGRDLAYLEVAGKDLSERMIRSGWAAHYVYDGKPVQRAARYQAAESSAKTGSRGIWSRCGGQVHRTPSASAGADRNVTAVAAA